MVYVLPDPVMRHSHIVNQRLPVLLVLIQSLVSVSVAAKMGILRFNMTIPLTLLWLVQRGNNSTTRNKDGMDSFKF